MTEAKDDGIDINCNHCSYPLTRERIDISRSTTCGLLGKNRHKQR
jgi:hypothetical protein